MENNRQKTLSIAGVIIIALLMIGMVFLSVSNSKRKKSLNSEKQTSEKLLSEKLSVEKELARLQTEYGTIRQKSEANQKLLDETNLKIADYEKRINSITNENRSARANKKELEELRRIKAELERESAMLKLDRDKLTAQNQDLQNSLAAKDAEKTMLNQQLESIKIQNADNFMVTATRGKKTEKLVILASRTKKLNMSFEVPGNLTEALSFRIVTPAGVTINSDDKAISWYVMQDARNFTASLSAVTGEFEQSRQVVLNYTSKGKLAKGEYKIQILSDGKNIGNCRIMLR